MTLCSLEIHKQTGSKENTIFNGRHLILFCMFVITTAVFLQNSLFISGDIVSAIKSWMHHSLATGLSKTRRDQKVQEICDIYFQSLERRFAGWQWFDAFISDVLFEKL